MFQTRDAAQGGCFSTSKLLTLFRLETPHEQGQGA